VNESLHLDRTRRKNSGGTEWWREDGHKADRPVNLWFFLKLGGFLQVPEIVHRNRKTDVSFSFEFRPGALSLPS